MYDDAEGALQDQGLEICLIPYRPSPPPPPRPQASRREKKKKKNDSTSDHETAATSAASSPASDESKECDNDNDEGATNTAPPPPPKTPKQLFTKTPRSQSAIDESLGQKVETTPPKQKSESTAENKQMIANTNNEKVTSQHGRSQSCTDPSTANATSTNQSTSQSSSSTSPPRRSKSSPTKSTTTTTTPTPPRNPSKKKRNPNHKPSMYQMAKLGYQELCNAIIRPPRSNYPLSALGPEEFTFCETKFVRRDFGVVNERGLLVECSIWKKVDDEDEEDEDDNEEEEREHSEQGQQDNNDKLERGEIILNVDDWDESKERGQMYLHVPESFEVSSTTSSTWKSDDDDEHEEEEDISVTSEQMRQAENMLNELSYDDTDDTDDDDDDESDKIQKMLQYSGTSSTNRKLKLSHQKSESTAHTYYRGATKSRKRRRDPVVIYLHGNSSGRTEVIPQLGHLLSLGVSVVAFDFAGSGKSEGEFVSLGYYEREDLHTVIKHLRASGDVSTIALWGRSMGAATAIMYGSRDPTICCLILDSSFTDLTRLAEEMVERGKEHGVNVPNFVVSVALRMIKSSIKTQAGFSIRHLSPISHANRCFIPAMFVAGEHDDFINKQHSEKIHAKYAGDKNIVIVDGDHNSPRPRFLLQSACLFLQSCMHLPPSSELVIPLGTNLLAPPWICSETFSKMMMGKMGKAAQAEKKTTTATSEERSWIPIDGVAQQQQQLQRQRSQPAASKSAEKKPPSLPLEKHSRSCTDATSPTTDDYMAASELPDMSERQKEIQQSLFKMLGQQE